MQQEHQKKILRTSGEPFEAQQLCEVSKGNRRKLKPLIALNMELTDVTLKEYGNILVDEERWSHLPAEHQTHSLAMAAFRSGVKSGALVYRHEKLPHRTYPFKSFGPLADDLQIAVKHTKDIIRDRQRSPCIMDPWSYENAGKYPTIGLQRSQENTAKLQMVGKLCDLENAVTEAENASDRRRIKLRLQQKVPHLADICVDHLYKHTRQTESSIFEDDDMSSDAEEDTTCEATQIGGGSCRAWISRHKDEFKDATGKVDFAKALDAYRSWKAEHADREEILSVRATGRAATRAAQAKAKSTALRSQTSLYKVASNFGTCTPRAQQSVQTQSDRLVLMRDFDERRAASSRTIYENDDEQLQLALIKQDPSKTVRDLVVAHGGNDLKNQLQVLQTLCLSTARKDSQARTEVSKRVKEFIASGTSRGGPHQQTQLADFMQIKVVPEELPVLRMHDRMERFAQKLVAKLVKEKSPMKSVFLKYVEAAAKLKAKDSIPDLPNVSDSFRPTHCFKRGARQCICTGTTAIVQDLFRKKFAFSLLILCPKDLQHRRLLLDVWLCARVGDNRWYHISDFCLSPVTTIVTKLQFKEELPTGEVKLELQLVDEMPPTLQDVEVGRDGDLDSPLTLELWKLSSKEVPHVPFTIARELTYERLDKYLPMIVNKHTFWKGSEEEVNLEILRRRKARDNEAKARQKRDAAKAAAAARGEGEAPPLADGDQPEARVHRDKQQPHGAGLLVPLSDDAAAAPVRLLADGVFAGGEGANQPASANIGGPQNVDEIPGGDGFAQDWHHAVCADDVPENAPQAKREGRSTGRRFWCCW